MDLLFRQAHPDDTPDIFNLLRQVNDIHADGRPDLFRKGMTKYTADELTSIFENPTTPVFVAVDADGHIVGYCFCIVQEVDGSHNMQPILTLYIDDLCVDSSCRGMHVGRRLFDYVRNYALTNSFNNITLNVWCCNPSAIAFYQKLGLTPYKIGMEMHLPKSPAT